jgi:hypothetical protein
MPRSLTPLRRDRLRQLLTARGWPRALARRRVVAGVLVLLAAVLAIRPPPQARGEPTAPMLVAARDLAAGSLLRPSDLRVVRAPESVRPPTALTAAEQASGRVLAGVASRGEPVTRARLVGRENSRLATGDPDSVAVPVRLADPEVAALLGGGPAGRGRHRGDRARRRTGRRRAARRAARPAGGHRGTRGVGDPACVGLFGTTGRRYPAVAMPAHERN